jgi:hypothetical protein
LRRLTAERDRVVIAGLLAINALGQARVACSDSELQ